VAVLADTLQMRESSEVQQDTYYLFAVQYSPLSNFAKSKFILEGTSYSCNEQFYQSEKAKFANNTEAYKKIMSSSLPGDMKAIGSKIRLDKKAWSEPAKKVMEKGIMAKFTQNTDLCDILQATGQLKLVECSRDQVWGNGVAFGSPASKSPTEWKGQNLLGEILSQARAALR
jgi:ribA/ribD-fused uncharacterized protein